MSPSHSETDSIRQQLQKWGHKKWGFVIYRCTYKNDAEWSQFMDFLNRWTSSRLKADDSLDMMESLDWSVQEGSDLEGASKDEVKK